LGRITAPWQRQTGPGCGLGRVRTAETVKNGTSRSSAAQKLNMIETSTPVSLSLSYVCVLLLQGTYDSSFRRKPRFRLKCIAHWCPHKLRCSPDIFSSLDPSSRRERLRVIHNRRHIEAFSNHLLKVALPRRPDNGMEILSPCPIHNRVFFAGNANLHADSPVTDVFCGCALATPQVTDHILDLFSFAHAPSYSDRNTVFGINHQRQGSADAGSL
jgi:hypothetical protein